MKNIEAPDHIKEKILLFFLKTSVPRIIEKKRGEKNEQRNATKAN